VWGAEQTNTTSSLFGWTGAQTDDETGLTYLRARYYSPTYSRFLSTDPIQPNAGGTQGFNAYAYAQNNPATLTDPSGMRSVRDLPGYAALSKAGQAGVLRHMERIKCILLGGGIGCIDLLVIGKAIQQFGKDHPCTEQCKNIVKWSALVALGVIAGTVLALCFPECEIAMAAAEGGLADGVVGGVFEELTVGVTEGILEEAAAETLASSVGIEFAESTAVNIEQGVFRTGLSNSAQFSQRTYGNFFSTNPDSLFPGRSILSVAEDLESGALVPEGIPVMVIEREGTTLILNTRSAVSLTKAGVDRSLWWVNDVTGIAQFEENLTARLLSNRLGSSGIDFPRAARILSDLIL